MQIKSVDRLHWLYRGVQGGILVKRDWPFSFPVKRDPCFLFLMNRDRLSGHSPYTAISPHAVISRIFLWEINAGAVIYIKIS